MTVKQTTTEHDCCKCGTPPTTTIGFTPRLFATTLFISLTVLTLGATARAVMWLLGI